ncbi:hypothetical protein Dimus_022644 [Dionaea muscipula]
MPRGQHGGGIRLAHDDEEDDFDHFRFPTAFHALISWPRFAERGIVSGRSVDLEQVDHKYLTDLLVGYGWGGLMDLPEIFEAFDIDLEDEEWTPTQGPISHAAVISSKISEKIAARQHARLQGGGAADAPPVVPPPPAHVPAPAPVPAQFSQFQHAVMERLDAFDRRFTQIRADSLRSSNSMARIQADQATQQSRIHSLSVAQAQMGSILSEMRTDIATSEERVLQSIDSLTQLFRRRFPSPSADP